MCYRGSENSVDFTGIHLACLTGDNGQGKSALLDAMTWALWGKARTSSADDLITRGEAEMEVQLEFDLGATRYRVIRKRSTAGRGSSLLEFQGRTESGFYTSLSEATLRDTQQRINDCLRLEYDTFVNSSFLLQGRADEFTTKRPAERKQILADILGLAQYDRYAERAKKRARVAEVRRAEAEVELAAIQETVAQIPSYAEEVVNAEAEAHALEGQLREATATLQNLFEQRNALNQKHDALTQAERRAQEGRSEMARLAGRLAELQSKVARFDALLARAAEIEAAMAQLEQAQAERDRWEELLHQSVSLEQESSALKQQIAEARAALEGDLKAALTQERTHRETLARFSSRERELAEAQKQVELLEKLREERETQQQNLMQRAETNAQLQTENQALKEEMTKLRERMDLLENSDAAICLICRRPLAPDARAEALSEAQGEGERMRDRYRENQRQMKQVEGEIKGTKQAIASADRQLAELGRWQRRAAEAMQAAEEMQRARQALTHAEEAMGLLRARLDSGDYAPEEQARLAELANASSSLGYDSARHEAARRTIKQLSARQQEARELNVAREQRAGTLEIMAALEESNRHHQQVVATAAQEIEALSQELRQQTELVRRIQEQQVWVNTLQRDRNVAERRHGAAQQKLADAESQAARQPAIEQAHHTAVTERTIYDQLATAFGKRGVQAMIIESAVPDIEAEANALLNRMSNGRMSVSILTQRELKSGDSSETLDIVIADEQGERPYETFSGGEAFRVNFALRIALSKLLAHRAGTNLRTLVMDEGFGSQDAQGRERLIEAITSVQDDFDRILVITHIEELKDAFPIRIDVVKGANGSRVWVG